MTEITVGCLIVDGTSRTLSSPREMPMSYSEKVKMIA